MDACSFGGWASLLLFQQLVSNVSAALGVIRSLHFRQELLANRPGVPVLVDGAVAHCFGRLGLAQGTHHVGHRHARGWQLAESCSADVLDETKLVS